MAKILRTKDKKLEVKLSDDGFVHIESSDTKNIGIMVQKLDPTDNRVPEGVKGAIYRINLYLPEDKSHPFEYGIAFIMPNGKLLSREGSYLKK